LSIEERVARIEGVLEQIDKRLNHLESELRSIGQRVEALSEKVDRSFRWTLGIMLSVLIPMWVSIILAMLMKG